MKNHKGIEYSQIEIKIDEHSYTPNILISNYTFMPSVNIKAFSSSTFDRNAEIAEVFDYDDNDDIIRVNKTNLDKYLKFYVKMEEKFDDGTK